ncbi:MAG: hypothetical protein OXC63_15625 [Aestuariivita sp.]|nr:hypothetical protein [Aestuariivita sp.]
MATVAKITGVARPTIRYGLQELDGSRPVTASGTKAVGQNSSRTTTGSPPSLGSGP